MGGSKGLDSAQDVARELFNKACLGRRYSPSSSLSDFTDKCLILLEWQILGRSMKVNNINRLKILDTASPTGC
jgi:hypothetical protein